MSELNDFNKLDDAIENLLSGEMDSLEGEQDAVALWQTLQTNPEAKKRYDAAVLAMRFFAGRRGKKSFGEDEADSLWPLVMGHVSEDARSRSGLSKQALRHMAVPNLVASISRAIMSFSQADGEETVIEAEVPEGTEAQAVNFSVASVGGQVSLRLFKNDDIGFVANVNGGEVQMNTENKDDAGAWMEVQSALNTLSMMTAQLLGDEALVNGQIEIKDGRAHVRLRPLNLSKKANG